MSEDKSGPAFPVPGWWADNNTSFPGMSLRDWFAGQAIAGMLSSPEWRPTHGLSAEERYAAAAYIMADKMLAERAK